LEAIRRGPVDDQFVGKLNWTLALMSSLSSPTPTSQSPADPESWIVYDGHCPFCTAYVRFLRLKDAVGPVKLIDAREDGKEVAEVRRANLSIDQGMVLKLGGRLYHGAECIHVLALLTSPVGLLNRVTAWVFKSDSRARTLYPVLRAGRNLALRLLGRKRLGY
jgi:predicted DCC family thiol-disulfide oxidoreductase YuxK